MKAAVFNTPGEPLQIQEVDKPSIAPDEMLVKVSRCGICGTDIHASRQGAFMAPPSTIFGHEFSGEIVEIGDKLAGGTFNLGDRVTSLPFIGDKTIGLGAVTGAYSEFVKVGYDLVVKLPDNLKSSSTFPSASYIVLSVSRTCSKCLNVSETLLLVKSNAILI